jgi:Na+-driven multidrug efflux pump
MTPGPRADLRLGRLTAVWLPLAATFLLVTGATPVINACINRLPDRNHELDLAAFALFLSCIVVLHSPLFVTREIAIKLGVDRAGARRALRFCLLAAAVISAAQLAIGLTPAGTWVLRVFSSSERVVAGAQDAFRWIWPAPFLIAIRGVYQAHQIRKDDTLFVGLGTAARLLLVALFGLLLAPRVGIPGPVLGSVAVVLGILVETVFSVVRIRHVEPLPETSTQEPLSVLGFALPLMFANLLGVFTSLFYLRVAAQVPEHVQEASLAAYQEARPLAWIFSAGGFALQSLTTAKVRDESDEGPMLRFSLIVGAGLSVALGLVVFVAPLRDWILIDLLGEERGGMVVEFAVPTLMVAVALPLLQAFRFTVRGVLISRGRTRTITVANIVTLTLVAIALAFGIVPPTENGSLNAYLVWIGVLLLELAMLVRFLYRPGDGDLPAPTRAGYESAGG